MGWNFTWVCSHVKWVMITLLLTFCILYSFLFLLLYYIKYIYIHITLYLVRYKTLCLVFPLICCKLTGPHSHLVSSKTPFPASVWCGVAQDGCNLRLIADIVISVHSLWWCGRRHHIMHFHTSFVVTVKYLCIHSKLPFFFCKCAINSGCCKWSIPWVGCSSRAC